MALPATSEHDILHELKGMKEKLRTRFGVTRIGVFGSVARGESTPESDVDIVVEMEPNLYKRSGLRAELEKQFGKRVDVIRYRRGMDARLKARIDKEARYV